MSFSAAVFKSGLSTDSGSLLCFLGKPSQDSENEQNSVSLEVLLVKVCHKKRKVCVVSFGLSLRLLKKTSPALAGTKLHLNRLSSCPGCELSGEAGPYREEAGSSEP